MEILRDPIWQFWGALLALVGIISGFVIYVLQRRKKNLAYEILTSSELLTANEELRGRIRITFDKRPVQNIHLLVIRIKNHGNVSIVPSDFYGEFTCSFGDNAKVLAAEITDCFPDSFKPQIELKDNSTTITPILINSKDFFVIKFLLSQFDKIKINGRISGVQDIKEYKTINFGSLIQPIGLIFLGLVLISKDFTDAASPEVKTISAIVLFFLSLAIVFILSAFYPRKKVND